MMPPIWNSPSWQIWRSANRGRCYPAAGVCMFAPLFHAAPALASSLTLFLHHPAGEARPAEACEIPLCASLLERVEAADRNVDLAIYGLRGQPTLLEALDRARARGVRVRVVVDADVRGENYYA